MASSRIGLVFRKYIDRIKEKKTLRSAPITSHGPESGEAESAQGESRGLARDVRRSEPQAHSQLWKPWRLTPDGVGNSSQGGFDKQASQ